MHRRSAGAGAGGAWVGRDDPLSEDANDGDALRTDPAFKMAVGRLPENGADLCSQPTLSRLENLPGSFALKRMMAAMHPILIKVALPTAYPVELGPSRCPSRQAATLT